MRCRAAALLDLLLGLLLAQGLTPAAERLTPPPPPAIPATPTESAPPVIDRAANRSHRFDFGLQVNLRSGREIRLGNGMGLWGGYRYCLNSNFSLGGRAGYHVFQVSDDGLVDNITSFPLLIVAQAEHSFTWDINLRLFCQVGGGISLNYIENAYQFRIFGPPPSPTFHPEHSAALAVLAGLSLPVNPQFEVGLSVEWLRSVAAVRSTAPSAPNDLDVGHWGIGLMGIGRF